jgi:ribosomal protein S4
MRAPTGYDQAITLLPQVKAESDAKGEPKKAETKKEKQERLGKQLREQQAAKANLLEKETNVQSALKTAQDDLDKQTTLRLNLKAVMNALDTANLPGD